MLDGGLRVSGPARFVAEVVGAHDHLVECRLNAGALVELHLEFVELVRQICYAGQ
jgi:hypothetical protein